MLDGDDVGTFSLLLFGAPHSRSSVVCLITNLVAGGSFIWSQVEASEHPVAGGGSFRASGRRFIWSQVEASEHPLVINCLITNLVAGGCFIWSQVEASEHPAGDGSEEGALCGSVFFLLPPSHSPRSVVCFMAWKGALAHDKRFLLPPWEDLLAGFILTQSPVAFISNVKNLQDQWTRRAHRVHSNVATQ